MRSCIDKHPEPIPEKCCRCYRWLHSQRHRDKWGGDGLATPAPAELVARWTPPISLTAGNFLGPCLHLGDVTGERRLCNTCRGKVELKVFACSHPAHGTTTAQDCRRCKDRSTVIRFDHSNLSPGQPGKRFNASLIEHGDGYLLAYRDGWAGSEVHVARLTRDFKQVSSRRLHLRHAQASYGREDPRLFYFQGQLHVCFTGVVSGHVKLHTNVLYARLSPTFRVEQVFAPQYDRRRFWEKNWQMFEHAGQLLAVYSIAPHRVLRIDEDRAELLHETPLPHFWNGGEPRGGAPPVRIGDEYWHFFHDRVSLAQLVYRVGLYTFEARPPFRTLRAIPGPVLVADQTTKPADQYCAVIFPGGAVFQKDRWLLSCGSHDRWIDIHSLNHAALDAALVKV